MGTAGDQAAGFFFVQVFRQASTDFRYRATNIGSTDHDGKVANVGSILLFKVNMEPILWDATGSESGPRPMGLSIHDAEQLFTKRFPIHQIPFRKSGILMNEDCNESAKA